MADLLGALAFAIGMVFLIVGRTELFSEDCFDPVAAAIDIGGRSPWLRLVRLWLVILVMSLAEEITSKRWSATLARAVLAGALITLLSYMLASCSPTSCCRRWATSPAGCC